MVDKLAIWAEVLTHAKEEHHRMTLQPDEITVAQFAHETDLTMAQARDYLNNLVKEGKAEKREIRNHTMAYKLT